MALRGPDERHKQPSSPPGDTRVYFLTQETLPLLSPAHCLPSVFKNAFLLSDYYFLKQHSVFSLDFFFFIMKKFKVKKELPTA